MLDAMTQPLYRRPPSLLGAASAAQRTGRRAAAADVAAGENVLQMVWVGRADLRAAPSSSSMRLRAAVPL